MWLYFKNKEDAENRYNMRSLAEQQGQQNKKSKLAACTVCKRYSPKPGDLSPNINYFFI